MPIGIKTKRALLIAAGVVVLLAAAAIAFLAPRWPFSEKNMKQRLEASTGSRIEFGKYHQFFFPHPGFTADQVRITPNEPDHPTVTINKISITGLYSGLLGDVKHVRAMSLDGLRLEFAQHGGDAHTKEAGKQGSASDQPPEPKQHAISMPPGVQFDQVEARNSVVAFVRGPEEKQSRTFAIYEVTLKSFAPGKEIHYNATVRIPQPEGEIQVSGIFGPLTGTLESSRLAGAFTLKHANLGSFEALTGSLDGTGEFDGPVDSLQMKGSTDSPDFGSRSTKHSLPLRTDFVAVVNGANGDIQFKDVKAMLGKSAIHATGQLAASPHGGDRVLSLHITSDDSNIQDLMALFLHSKPPLAGQTRFAMEVQLPQNSRKFDDRIKMDARFGIRQSHFTHSTTEEKISKLSEQAQGNPKDTDPPAVLTNLLGDVKLADGTARFSRLDLAIPGASANLQGTYNLDSDAVNLHGTMHTSVKLSKATTGFKAFFMKVTEALKHTPKQGATVPVHITGTYDKPEFGIDATAEK